MPDEVSEIGVRLTLDASGFKAGITGASDSLNKLQAQAEQAGSGSRGSRAGGGKPTSTGTPMGVDVTLSVSQAEIGRLRKTIQAGLGAIPVTIQPQFQKSGNLSLPNVLGSMLSMQYGTPKHQAVREAGQFLERFVGQTLPQKARGGPVQQGRPVIVGERRPEVFVPRQSGDIVPSVRDYYRHQERARRQEVELAALEFQQQQRQQRQMDDMERRLAQQHRHGGGYAQRGSFVGDWAKMLGRIVSRPSGPRMPSSFYNKPSSIRESELAFDQPPPGFLRTFKGGRESDWAQAFVQKYSRSGTFGPGGYLTPEIEYAKHYSVGGMESALVRQSDIAPRPFPSALMRLAGYRGSYQRPNVRRQQSLGFPYSEILMRDMAGVIPEYQNIQLGRHGGGRVHMQGGGRVDPRIRQMMARDAIKQSFKERARTWFDYDFSQQYQQELMRGAGSPLPGTGGYGPIRERVGERGLIGSAGASDWAKGFTGMGMPDRPVWDFMEAMPPVPAGEVGDPGEHHLTGTTKTRAQLAEDLLDVTKGVYFPSLGKHFSKNARGGRVKPISYGPGFAHRAGGGLSFPIKMGPSPFAPHAGHHYPQLGWTPGQRAYCAKCGEGITTLLPDSKGGWRLRSDAPEGFWEEVAARNQQREYREASASAKNVSPKMLGPGLKRLGPGRRMGGLTHAMSGKAVFTRPAHELARPDWRDPEHPLFQELRAHLGEYTPLVVSRAQAIGIHLPSPENLSAFDELVGSGRLSASHVGSSVPLGMDAIRATHAYSDFVAMAPHEVLFKLEKMIGHFGQLKDDPVQQAQLLDRIGTMIGLNFQTATPATGAPSELAQALGYSGRGKHAWSGRVAEAYRATLAHGGGTFPVDPSTPVPSHGHALGIGKLTGTGTEMVNRDDPLAFIRAFHKQKRAGAPFVGTWLPEGENQIYVDPSVVLRIKREADMVARFGEEQAMFNLKTFEDEPTSAKKLRATADRIREIVRTRSVKRQGGGGVLVDPSLTAIAPELASPAVSMLENLAELYQIPHTVRAMSPQEAASHPTFTAMARPFDVSFNPNLFTPTGMAMEQQGERAARLFGGKRPLGIASGSPTGIAAHEFGHLVHYATGIPAMEFMQQNIGKIRRNYPSTYAQEGAAGGFNRFWQKAELPYAETFAELFANAEINQIDPYGIKSMALSQIRRPGDNPDRYLKMIEWLQQANYIPHTIRLALNRHRSMGGLAHAMAGNLDVGPIEGNLRKYFNLASTAQHTKGMDWYASWGKQLRDTATQLGFPPEVLTAAAAALSPNNGWPGNFFDAIKYATAAKAGQPMPKASTFGANQLKAWNILTNSDPSFLKGLKVNPFSHALLGDPNATPQDIWMKRAAVDDLLLPRTKGTPSPRQRREMDRVTAMIAAENSIEPRQAQAIIWEVVRDMGMEKIGLSKHMRLSARGGPAYAARGVIHGEPGGEFFHYQPATLASVFSPTARNIADMESIRRSKVEMAQVFDPYTNALVREVTGDERSVSPGPTLDLITVHSHPGDPSDTGLTYPVRPSSGDLGALFKSGERESMVVTPDQTALLRNPDLYTHRTPYAAAAGQMTGDASLKTYLEAATEALVTIGKMPSRLTHLAGEELPHLPAYGWKNPTPIQNDWLSFFKFIDDPAVMSNNAIWDRVYAAVGEETGAEYMRFPTSAHVTRPHKMPFQMWDRLPHLAGGGFLSSVMQTMTDWAKDPYMAIMAYQAQQAGQSFPGKASGGSADKGLYIVGEIGPELFVPDHMKGMIPKKVMDQIPHARGGMEIIGQRPNSLFAPAEDGIIVPNRLMAQVPHAARGVEIGPGDPRYSEALAALERDKAVRERETAAKLAAARTVGGFPPHLTHEQLLAVAGLGGGGPTPPVDAEAERRAASERNRQRDDEELRAEQLASAERNRARGRRTGSGSLQTGGPPRGPLGASRA